MNEEQRALKEEAVTACRNALVFIQIRDAGIDIFGGEVTGRQGG